jgi:hypothetical protein
MQRTIVMSRYAPGSRRRGGGTRGIVLVLAALTAAGAAGAWSLFRGPPDAPVAPPRAVEAADLPEKVHQLCSACHAYPPPETFPRFAWKKEVELAYDFIGKSSLPLAPLPLERVVAYYEARAPQRLPPATIERARTPLPLRFVSEHISAPPGAVPPSVSNVNLVHLSDRNRLDILACEMKHGLVMALRPYESQAAWRILGKVKNPAHAEVVDLDGDGILDVVVACLGNYSPTDKRCGSVVWLRGKKDGTFTPHTLLKDVGRVADVQAADFNGDGKLDLVVAVFGWRAVGEIVVLENCTTDWDHPQFKTHVVDTRHGAIHVPVMDLDGDGKPDFVALISQEHEQVCAFRNEGDFKFTPRPLYTAPHPAYGSSGIQLVDLDGDGHIDVLYTNGDALDAPYLLKPYHGVQWLRNLGTGKLEFEHRPIGPLYGVHRALAADFLGNGRLDVVAVAYLPAHYFPQRQEQNLDAMVLFEQVAPGRFVRHTLASNTCDHVTCAVGDLYGTGRIDIVAGQFTLDDRSASAVVLRNLGRPGHQ